TFPPLSPKQHLQKALESLTQAYKGLEKKKEKEEEKRTKDYTRSILAPRNPLFIQRKRKGQKSVLRGLVEEVRASRKGV
ncbi:uncharacterized protein K441DRAFT_652880, partial [Cenococcum geophilum 1.58]|uniref:uncharacterized protein n=1 Tax=Cenococcum geophilum 1.58 TaxID=794803 RepID=UPI0035900C5F